jgi:arabinogalactan oligomer / maltooligosaccharide transport system permease protein
VEDVTLTAPAKATYVPKRRIFGADARVAFLYLIPAFAVMSIITFYPLLYQVWMSFTDFQVQNIRVGAPAPPWVWFDNYIKILTNNIAGLPNYDFARILAFNLFWAFSNVILHLILGVAIALLLNQKGLIGRGIYRAIFVLPVVIPPIIVATVWHNMFDQSNGAINYLIAFLTRQPPGSVQIAWLTDPGNPIPFFPLLPLAYFALLTANVWLGWPLNAVVATGALQSIPKDLYEAVEMDGGGAWTKFRVVTLTYLRPAMLPYAIYGFVITFNLFYLSYFMSAGGPFGRTELLVTQAYRLVNDQHLYGVAAAFSVIMFFILLVLTLVTNKLTKATGSYVD